MFRKVDCVVVRVPELASALDLYVNRLGHPLIRRRDDQAAGLRLDDSETELVVMAGEGGTEADSLVESVNAAVESFVRAGGSLVGPVEEIAVGRRATLQDPWGNELPILDLSKGRLRTDATGNAIE
jgi:lactoylglutathione lyase